MYSTMNSQRSYLAVWRIPELTFGYRNWKDARFAELWTHLRDKDYHRAMSLCKEIRRTLTARSTKKNAAVLIAQAYAELTTGSTDLARRHAGRAIDIYPTQWSGHRILLATLAANQGYKAAYMHLVSLDPGPVPVWDESLTNEEINTALAGWSWQLGDWDGVARHLDAAFPQGVDTMPPRIQEDWFKLSLYRDRPNDAVAVAVLLISHRDVATTDELLQTFVQNGWTKEALPLYRAAFESAPKSELLRRRLVALCIREGALEEARRLTQPGALDLAA
jgi:tetratricopeptide (TPR) repeat protein